MHWLQVKKIQFEVYTSIGMLEYSEKATICILSRFGASPICCCDNCMIASSCVFIKCL